MRAKCKSDKAKLGKEMTMKQDVSISINAITEQIRYKIINYGSMWVTATQALLCLTVGYYVGIAEFGAKDDFESLYQRADKAMYKAKVGGRDQSIICFEECALCNSDLQTNANVDALGLSGK